ncbi:hypothetical protein KQX54_015230 [Cotesia glomerata]|uniref:Protein-lysine N-methyltransferase SMYD4 n=2 Tax=Cotesia glomerata TaxID=32391 RepID=A0AAV7I619_COTGL|nr:hypothetical protein KQX54_015230 [Cotesia glomerata]
MDLDSIIKLYTKSVAYAPVNSYILSLAYANRSLALFKARLYRDCIDDIEHALLVGCPEKLKIKLDARKVRCREILDSPNSTLERGNFRELEQVSKQLEKVDLNAKTMKTVAKTTQNSDESVSKNNEFIKLDGNRNLPQVPNDNEEIPGASSAIKLVYSEEFGRHVVATRDIEPGEVLAVQQGYVSNLFPENFYSHCIYCMKQTWSGIPCDKCVYAIYCSENCRKAAWINHHDIECQVVGPLIEVGMENLGLMSLRLLVSAYKETEDFKVLKNQLKIIDSLTDPRTRGFTGKILDDKKYASVYTLETNSENRPNDDLFERSFKAAYITFVLAKKTEIFGKILPGDLGNLRDHQWFTFVGGLIMRHQQIIPNNAHMRSEESSSLFPHEHGSALMPFFSLFNHSCVPSIFLGGFGNKIAAISTRVLKKNQQIFDNYGMHYVHVGDKRSRQTYLQRRFFFVCKCEACTDVSFNAYGPESYMFKGLGSQANVRIHKALKNFNKYFKMFMFENDDIIEDSEAVINDLNNMLKVLEEYVDLYCCTEAIKIFSLWEKVYSLRGNRWQSVNV